MKRCRVTACAYRVHSGTRTVPARVLAERGRPPHKDSPADPWTDPERVRVRLADPPAAVITATRLLASAMALRYAAFDFLIRDGTPVFLEVNPDGDWRWAERRSGTGPVTLAAARMLTELHHRVRRALPRTVDQGIKPIDLLAFLSKPAGA